MARNKTVLSILQSFRSEIRASGNVAHNKGARENHLHLVQRTQERLWEEYDWPHLRVRRNILLQAGQRYYDTPEDINIDRVEKIEVRYGDDWIPLFNGIHEGHYSAWSSDLDQRSWPVERWQIYEGEMIEVWPIPADNADTTTLDGTLRVTGIRNLRDFVDDDDRADLDDMLIYMYAAAEQLASRGAEDAALKLRLAEKRKRTLIGNNSKMQVFSIGGNAQPEGKRLQGPPRVHYRDRETG